MKAPEPEAVAASEPLPAKRKERSLSSLVVNTPRVSVQTTMTGRRTKPTRKASSLRSSSFSIDKSIKKEAELLDDCPESSSSPEASNKLRQNNGQVERDILALHNTLLYFLVLLCSTDTSDEGVTSVRHMSRHQHMPLHSNISLSQNITGVDTCVSLSVGSGVRVCVSASYLFI